MKFFILIAMLFALTLSQALVTDIEVPNGHRCNGQQWCNQANGRICSAWGWCQNSDYSGPRSRGRTIWHDLRSVEQVNGHRCAGVCDSGRICSAWGWCQNGDYTGPTFS